MGGKLCLEEEDAVLLSPASAFDAATRLFLLPFPLSLTTPEFNTKY